jgi:beta-glucanase (GH16 family)
MVTNIKCKRVMKLLGARVGGLTATAGVLLLSSSLTQQVAMADPPAGTTWTKVFEDNFDGTSLDATKWTAQWTWPSGTGNWTVTGQKDSTPDTWFSPANIIFGNVIDGRRVLTIVARREALWGYNYTSGVISTGGKQNMGYGYYEICLKAPANDKGSNPSSFLFSTDATWPPELDIVEIPGGKTHGVGKDAIQSVHYNGGAQSRTTTRRTTYGDGFHVFGVDWQADKVTFYVDGVAKAPIYNVSPQKEMYLLIANEVGHGGASWAGDPSGVPMPQYTYVDYIRVWKK